MSETDPNTKESIASDNEPDKRDMRALTEYLTVLPSGGDIYTIVSESGREYQVDVRESRCTCPDHKYRDVQCKHIRRVEFEIGERPIPSAVNPEAIPDDFKEHIETDSPSVRFDGGIIDAENDNEDDEEGCLCDTSELGCFEHYRSDKTSNESEDPLTK